MKYYSIAIIGAVGVGKSTLAEALKEPLKAQLIDEPWEANPYIQDLPNNIFSCQWKAMSLQHANHMKMRELQKKSKVIMDRTLYEAFDLFTRQFQRSLTEEEFHALRQQYANLQTTCPKPDVVIALQAPAQICWDRIRSRGRQFETSGYSLDYCQDQAFLIGGLVAQLKRKTHTVEVDGIFNPEQVKTEALRKLRAFERFQLNPKEA